MGRAKGRKRAARWTPLLSKRTAAAPGKASGRQVGRLSASAAAKGRGRKAARPTREPLTPEQLERLREILALVLFGLTTFVLLACASAGKGDNLCGPTGEALAGLLLGTIGYAAYLLVAVLGLWGGMLFTRSRDEEHHESFSLRLSGLALCLVAFSALLAHVFADAEGAFPAGGVVGEFINERLMVAGGLGHIGTRIVLLVLTLITLVLATDIAYYASLVAGAAWGKEKHAVHVAEKVARQEAAQKEAAKAAEQARKRVELATSDEVARKRSLWSRFKKDKAADERALREEADALDAELRRGKVLEAFEAVKDEPGVPLVERAGELPVADEDLEEEIEDALDEDLDDDELDDDEEWEDEEEFEEDEDDALELEDQDEDEDAAVPVRTTRDVPPVQLMLDQQGFEMPGQCEPGEYVFPSGDFLEDQQEIDHEELDELLAEKTKVLERTLASFKVEGRVVEIQKGPVISMFEMELAPGIKVEKVRSLEDDLAIALRARTVRIVAPIPGKNTIGIEVPNPLRETVVLKPLLTCKEYTEGKFALPIFLGKDAAGHPMVVDLAKMPHLLVAGATGSGKSVCLNAIIASFLFTRTPEQVKLILIDPKMVELSQFANAPHLASPVISDMKRAPAILEWAVNKMEERYKLLSGAGVRNIYSYNKLGVEGLRERFGDRVDGEDFPRFLPFIVIIVDELADLMMTAAKEVETSITRLAAKSRAVGIHIILATQRPSTNVITGLIKANLPTRIAFMVSSKIDSRVILDVNGADQLLGQGDMLFLPPHSSHVVRGQCTYISEEEVRDMMREVKAEAGPVYERELVQRKDPGADQDPTEVDDLYDAATRFIFETQRGSASLLQRKFAIGYTRASRLIDLMAEEGVLGEYKGSQARELTMTLDDWIAMNPDARGSDAEGGA